MIRRGQSFARAAKLIVRLVTRRQSFARGRFCDKSGGNQTSHAVRACLLTALALLLGRAAGAAAPQTQVALMYEVAPDAEGCPDSTEFSGRVERQIRCERGSVPARTSYRGRNTRRQRQG